MQRILQGLVIVVTLGVTVVGAAEAWSTRSVLRSGSTCGTWNWCAPSMGGAENCNDCCVDVGDEWGLCIDDREAEMVGCLCGSG